MSPDKGLLDAITAAGRAGVELVVAAKAVEPAERSYFEDVVKPLLGPGVHWAGEVDGAAKRLLLARARCLLFPISWSEPFGMVMIEALACGTPVVALRRGSVPEVVRDGVTGGLVCDSVEQLPGALWRVAELAPAACRADALARFDVARMCEDYLGVYRRVLGRWSVPGSPADVRGLLSSLCLQGWLTKRPAVGTVERCPSCTSTSPWPAPWSVCWSGSPAWAAGRC